MPYRIITPSGTIIQYKILDFFGNFEWEVIDCRTKAGQERYKQLYGRSFAKKKRKNRQVLLRAGLRQLIDFFTKDGLSKPQRRCRASYDRHYNPAPPESLEPVVLPFSEQQAIQGQNGFQGHLYHIFLTNSFDYFKQKQQQANVSIFSSNCQWDDIIRLELARIRLGFEKLDQYLDFLECWGELRVECGIVDKNVPSQSHYINCLNGIGSQTVQEFFHRLRLECEYYNLYDSKIDIWDGRFLNSYSTGQNRPKSGYPSDPDVGAYVHGKKYIGTGYLESRIINSRFRLPKFYSLVNPQWNDNQTFQKTFQDMIGAGIRPAEIILADGGPKAHKSAEMVTSAQSAPIIAAPKNAAGLVLVTEKNRLFYAKHIPEIYWPILDSTFDKRTRVEQDFGHDSGTYAFTRIPHLGKELSVQFTGLINCQALLTALTAIKTDQFHLVTRPGAFRKLGLAYQGLTLDEVQQYQKKPVTPRGVLKKIKNYFKSRETIN